jgi:malate synthase
VELAGSLVNFRRIFVGSQVFDFVARSGTSEILTPESIEFLTGLHVQFEQRRQQLLVLRRERQNYFDNGGRPSLPGEGLSPASGEWSVPLAPSDLLDRRVEITGPVDRKMMINALNSGAKVFMADFEDSTAPTWGNIVDGHLNVRDAQRRSISFDSGEKHYHLNDEVATLMVRPRGWHLTEKHVRLDDQPMSASLFDFGLAFFLNATTALERGSGPYFYLPKLEGAHEAQLWADVFAHSEHVLGIARGSIRATVLIETLPAAFEMKEILYALRDFSVGLNAGRWDYIFSTIKRIGSDPAFILPDRSDVTMTVPFMKAYSELLVRTCHRHGAHAIGGMAAFIPDRKNAEATAVAIEKVRIDKLREATSGFDGTWVAHPDLVSTARDEFDRVLGSQPNQLSNLRLDVSTTSQDLLALDRTGGHVTIAGVATNVDVGIRYLAAWLGGTGAAAIHGLMEDAATAEISRSQIWQWVHHRVSTSEGVLIDADYVRSVVATALDSLVALADDEEAARYQEAAELFVESALHEPITEFLTLAAYERLD